MTVSESIVLASVVAALETYISRWNGLVKLYRTGKRVGLIQARTLGAQKSIGDVIVILDAHCECVGVRRGIASLNRTDLDFELGDQLAAASANAYCSESESIGRSDRRWTRMEYSGA